MTGSISLIVHFDQRPEGVAQPDNSKNAQYVAGKDQEIKGVSDGSSIKNGVFYRAVLLLISQLRQFPDVRKFGFFLRV